MLIGALLAMSLFQLGRGMVLVGLIGLLGFWTTRRGRRPSTGPVGESQDWVMRVTKTPLTIVGVVGAVLWIIAVLRP